ncbi:MAG: HAD family hydrolase [Anaerolineales bacterium]|nr:HAD family hydrolase [Anaerolineales bacterium]
MPESQRDKQCILFDWGNTLMRDFPGFSGPMYTWPHVEAIPYVAEVLAQLRPHWLLALATNAAASDENDIAKALQRAGLDIFIDKIFCQRRIGHKKPAPEYYDYVLHDLGLRREKVVMVGNDYTNDIAGANRSGLRAIWLIEDNIEQPPGDGYRIIHDFRELPTMLEIFMKQ